MTITIELPPDQEAKLQALAGARGTDLATVLRDLVSALPEELEPVAPPKPTANGPVASSQKTTAEILADWDEEGTPSVYGRDPADATDIARRLRREAERRGMRR